MLKLEGVVGVLTQSCGTTSPNVGAIRWKGLSLNGVSGYKKTLSKANLSEGYRGAV